MNRKLKIQFYRDKKKEWRWRIKSGAKVLADSGEGYKRLASAVKGCHRLGIVGLELSKDDVRVAWGQGWATVEVIR